MTAAAQDGARADRGVADVAGTAQGPTVQLAPRDKAGPGAEMLGHTSSKITKEHYIEPDETVNPVTAEILQVLAPNWLDGER